MSILGKKVGQLRQWTAEKTGKAEKTDVGDDFKLLESVVEAKKDQFEKLANETKHYLQSSGKMKLIPQTTNKSHSMSTLGFQMIQCGASFPEDSVYGNSLIKCGESFEKVGGFQHEAESTMNEVFLQPLQQALDGDLKEWQHQKKKLENRRLDYDAKNAKQRSSKAPTPELEGEITNAKAKFEETLQACKELMEKIVSENEDTEIQHLTELVEAQRAYFEKGLDVFTQLSKVLTDPNVKGNRSLGSRQNPDEEAGSTSSSKISFTRKLSSTGHSLLEDDQPSTPPPKASKPTPVPSSDSFSFAASNSSSNFASAPAPAAAPVPKARPKPKAEKRVGLFAFAPENPDELPFGKGDVISVLMKNDDGWWVGELNGRKGVFPSNYTAPVDE